MTSAAFIRVLLLCSLATAGSGCRDAKVATYRIPKEKEAAADAAAAPAPAGPMADTGGQIAATIPAGNSLVWEAPASWTAKPPGATRKGSYQVGAAGDLSITAFPGDVGGELANINRWRGQVGLAALGPAELAANVTRTEHNGLKVAVVDMAGGGQRILGAIVPVQAGGAAETWFFKLMGPDAAMAAEKKPFLDFVQTVKPAAGSAK